MFALGAPPHRDTPKVAGVAGVTGGGGIITAGGMAPKGGFGKTSDGSGAGKPSTSSGGCLGRKKIYPNYSPERSSLSKFFGYRVRMMRLWGLKFGGAYC